MKSLISLFIGFTVSLFSLAAHCQGGIDTKGGGHVILSGDHFFLLDLYEANITDSVWIGDKSDAELSQRIAVKNKKLEPVAELISKKMVDVLHTDPVFALGILKAIEMYDWVFTDHDLQPTLPDSPLTPAKIYQAAVRQGFAIYIDQKIWDKIPATHQAALVIHEALMALTKIDSPESRSRQINAVLFSTSFSNMDKWQLKKYLNSALPSSTDFLKKDSCIDILGTRDLGISDLCTALEESGRVLVSIKDGSFIPFLKFGYTDSNYLRRKFTFLWAENNGQRNIHWMCGFFTVHSSYETSSVGLNLHFIQPTLPSQKLPSKLYWGYSTNDAEISYFESDYLRKPTDPPTSAMCERDYPQSDAWQSILETLAPFTAY